MRQPALSHGSERDLHICGLRELPTALKVFQPEAVLSLIDPEGADRRASALSKMVTHAGIGTHKVLVLHDIHFLAPPYVAPDRQMVAEIVDFGECTRGKRTLVHCHAGISRSTAAALIILAEDALAWDDREPPRAAHRTPFDIADLRRQAYPNPLVVGLWLQSKPAGFADAFLTQCDKAFGAGWSYGALEEAGKVA